MRKSKPNLPLILLVGVLSIAASAPVAMRIEVQPQGAESGGTAVVVLIQVSPEDRTRIGSNAMVRIEIDGEAPPGQSPLWAVSLENDGSAEIETTWPPGEHDLRVEIASPSGKDTGLWVGKVRVPDFGASADAATTPVRPTPVPEPAPVSDPTVAADGAGVVAVAPSVPEASTAPPSPEGPAASPVDASDELDEGGEHSTETDSRETGAAGDAVERPEADLQSVDEPPPPPEPEIEAAVAAAGAATTTLPELAPSPKADQPEPAKATAAPSQPPPVVQPVQSPGSPPTAEPLRSDSVTAPAPQSAEPLTEVLAAYEEWQENADPDSTDMTVVVMRNRQSVPDLGTSDLELRVGGSPVPITDIGDAKHAPLLLGVAVDLSDENVGQWGQVSRDLTPLIRRAGGGPGRLFVTTTGAESDWDANPEQMDEAIVTPSSGDLAALISDSLAKFDGRRGRAFLLVLTDGRIEPSKEAWREAAAALESAGVPVLVMALWDEGFRKKLRKDLQQVASMSGGRLFMLQALNQMEGAVERFGGVLDAGVALRFETPPVGKGPLQIVVTAPDRTLDITAPRAIR